MSREFNDYLDLTQENLRLKDEVGELKRHAQQLKVQLFDMERDRNAAVEIINEFNLAVPYSRKKFDLTHRDPA